MVNKTKTLYLHIGTSKTGSSAIQHFCSDNAEVLAEKGYCYRKMPYAYSDYASAYRNAHFLLEKFYDENGTPDYDKRDRKVLEGLALVAEWFEESDNVILTDESLWNGVRGDRIVLFSQIKDFCRDIGVKLKVIVYLRPQDDFANSLWKERVRTGRNKMEIEEFINNPPGDLILGYHSHLTKIEQEIGQENILVRRYEKGYFGGTNHTIYSDFLETIGLEFTQEYVISQNEVNKSIGNNYIEIKRILNRLQNDKERVNSDVSKYFAKPALICSALQTPVPRESMLTKEQRERIMRKYEAGNAKVLERYFPGEDALFHEQETGISLWRKNNETMYEDIILYFGAISLYQKQETDALKQRINQLEEQVKEDAAQLQVVKKILSPARAVKRKLSSVLKEFA